MNSELIIFNHLRHRADRTLNISTAESPVPLCDIMQKLFLIILIFLLTSCALSAQIPYCNFFKLNAEEINYNGKKGVSIYPEIVSIPGDSISNFISNHTNRFEYILYNRLDSLQKYSKLYPDTVAIQKHFCSNLMNSKRIKDYFSVLTGVSETPEIYTEQEMMLIASRFFLCDKVNQSDTTVGYHICVGINGQKELNSNKDYTTLEAFCFEAIFHFYKEGRPQFVTNFIRYIKNSTSRHKVDFTDFSKFLENVKTDCYSAMESDESLRKSLLLFYQLNKENISIKII
jgi:hypothetical protein